MFKEKEKGRDSDQYIERHFLGCFVEFKLYIYCLLRAANLPFPQYLYF